MITRKNSTAVGEALIVLNLHRGAAIVTGNCDHFCTKPLPVTAQLCCANKSLMNALVVYSVS